MCEHNRIAVYTETHNLIKPLMSGNEARIQYDKKIIKCHDCGEILPNDFDRTEYVTTETITERAEPGKSLPPIRAGLGDGSDGT